MVVGKGATVGWKVAIDRNDVRWDKETIEKRLTSVLDDVVVVIQ